MPAPGGLGNVPLLKPVELPIGLSWMVAFFVVRIIPVPFIFYAYVQTLILGGGCGIGVTASGLPRNRPRARVLETECPVLLPWQMAAWIAALIAIPIPASVMADSVASST